MGSKSPQDPLELLKPAGEDVVFKTKAKVPAELPDYVFLPRLGWRARCGIAGSGIAGGVLIAYIFENYFKEKLLKGIPFQCFGCFLV